MTVLKDFIDRLDYINKVQLIVGNLEHDNKYSIMLVDRHDQPTVLFTGLYDTEQEIIDAVKNYLDDYRLKRNILDWVKLTNSFSSKIIGNEYTLTVKESFYNKIKEQFNASYAGVVKQPNQSTYEIAGNKVTVISE